MPTGDRKRHQRSDPLESWGIGRTKTRQHAAGGVILFDDGHQVSRHLPAIVQSSTECKSLAEQRHPARSSNIRAKLPEIADTCDAPVDEYRPLGATGHSGDPSADSFARDHCLMHLAFNGGSDAAIRFTLQRECDVSGQREFAKKASNLDVISRFGKPDVESRRR